MHEDSRARILRVSPEVDRHVDARLARERGHFAVAEALHVDVPVDRATDTLGHGIPGTRNESECRGLEACAVMRFEHAGHQHGHRVHPEVG